MLCLVYLRMDISYDFEETISEEQRKEMYDGELGIALIQMRELVEQRLSVLKEEIEWQSGRTVICITTTDVLQIRHYNVTKDLGDKMVACISQRDYEYIMKKIWDELYPGLILPAS